MTRFLWRTLNIVLLLFLPLPLVIVAVVSFSPDRFLSFPPPGFSLVWYIEFLSSAKWMAVVGVSAAIAAVAALFACTLAVLAALALDAAPARLRGVCETLILAPLIFPHAAVGIALYGMMNGLEVLDGTFIGICAAHIILCGPFAYRPISVALGRLEPAMAEAAMNLGATRRETFFRVTLPLLRPGMVTALLFTFILSFDEVTVTLFLVSPQITTLPIEIFHHVEQSADPVVAAIATFLVLASVLLVVVLQRTVGLQLFLGTDSDDRRSGGAS
ncbi:ABC transporter permease [Humitalea sp. 24SJ18S-53]|uniref:ABC transporter permease n=1 Tax=Humitalea sp. 24SJ18S-53 TaxID=3422307 RepID=UPI003D6754EB